MLLHLLLRLPIRMLQIPSRMHRFKWLLQKVSLKSSTYVQLNFYPETSADTFDTLIQKSKPETTDMKNDLDVDVVIFMRKVV